MIRLSLLLSCFLLTSASSVAQDSDIPDFGEGKAVSLNQEYYLGRAWLTAFRRRAPILNDAQVQDYVEGLVYRLASTSRLKDRRLEIIVLRNKSINAFAIPGGIVGVHSGLILRARNEAQFASVLSHELAHLSERHFARGLATESKSFASGMAEILRAQASIAAVSPDAANDGQVFTTGSQPSYGRAFEDEADTIGISNQARARLNPGGAADMLAVMQGDAPAYESTSSSYLLSHPVTESRIANARKLASSYPNKVYEDNRVFQLMRARVELNFFEDSSEAVAYFRQKQKKGGRNAVAIQYGLVIALTKNSDFDEARSLLQPMREFAPSNIVYALAEANIDIESENFEAAISRLENLLQLTPKNHPITMYLSKAYYFAGRYSDAAELLTAHSRIKPDDAYLWFLLAEDRAQAGDIMEAHQARAEYFRLSGDIQQGIEQLNLAVKLARDGIARAGINTRLAHFQSVAVALQQL